MMNFAPQAAHIMKVPREAFPAAVSYLRICGGGICVITWYNLIGSIFRAVGDSRTPLIAVMLACAGNVAGDLLFVAVFHMGAAGAAAATVGSQALSVLLSLRMMAGRQLPFAFRRNMLAWDSARIRKILGIGTPIAIQDFLVSISFLIIQAIVNTLGVTASAGVGVAEKVCGFIMLVPSSFMQSLAAFVSQNIGADQANRAVKGLHYAILTSLAVGAGLGYLSFFHGGVLTGLFSNDPAVIQAGWDYLRAYAIDCMLTPIFFCFIGFYNGVGRTKFVMLQGIVSAFLVRVPVSFLMSRIQPVSLFRIGLATPASSLLQIVLSLIYYHSLKRELKRQHEKKYI
jgi:putative MATE family efflux protein